MRKDRTARNMTCGDCTHYCEAPAEWVARCFGWCCEWRDWTEADRTLYESECRYFEPEPGFDPQPEEEDWRERRYEEYAV